MLLAQAECYINLGRYIFFLNASIIMHNICTESHLNMSRRFFLNQMAAQNPNLCQQKMCNLIIISVL